MNPIIKSIFLFLTITFGVRYTVCAQSTIKNDSINVAIDSTGLRYDFKNTQKGGLFLNDLAKKEVIFDKFSVISH